MITYTAMTHSQTFEDRIVSVINTGIDATAPTAIYYDIKLLHLK